MAPSPSSCRARRAVLGALVAAVSAVPTALSASAADAAGPASHVCSDLWNAGAGVVAGLTVQGDLVVDDPGAGCRLTDVTVQGDLVVPPGVTVTGRNVLVQHDLRSAGSVVLGDHLAGAYIDGDVLLDGGEDTRTALSSFQVRGDVRGRTGDLVLDSGWIYGTVEVAVVHVTRLRGVPDPGGRSVFSGPVTVRGGRLLVHDASFEAGLTVEDAGDVLVCRTLVEQDLLVTRLTDYARIGVEATHRCDTAVDRSLVLLDNPHSVDLGQLWIKRHLVCDGNTGPRGVTRTSLTSIGGGVHGTC